jgi:hypothetical protein
MRLYCYVVDHDTGRAPNPDHGVCTLVYCKYKRRGVKKRNVVELAKKGDWIVGVGGTSRKSCGRGKIIYIMRVDETLPYEKYRRRFPQRLSRTGHGEFTLISHTFLYYGRDAMPINEVPAARKLRLGKTGRGFRSKFDERLVEQLESWVRKQPRLGKLGLPCAPEVDCAPEKRCRCRK